MFNWACWSESIQSCLTFPTGSAQTHSKHHSMRGCKGMNTPCFTFCGWELLFLMTIYDVKAKTEGWDLIAELFNIPYWDCTDTVKAPFSKGLERNEHSISPILWLGVGFLGCQA